MNKPHKWAKEIKAWADGAEIEYKNNSRKMCWTKCESPVFDTEAEYEYRIKPQPKEPQYVYVWLDKEMGKVVFDYEPPHIVKEDEVHKYIGKIKLEVDNE
jgi:hypothetical protein